MNRLTPGLFKTRGGPIARPGGSDKKFWVLHFLVILLLKPSFLCPNLLLLKSTKIIPGPKFSGTF